MKLENCDTLTEVFCFRIIKPSKLRKSLYFWSNLVHKYIEYAAKFAMQIPPAMALCARNFASPQHPDRTRWPAGPREQCALLFQSQVLLG